MALRLVHKDGHAPVQIGEQVTDFRGGKAFVTGWQEPQHIGSTGRVYTSPDGNTLKAFGFYPSVFGLEWEGYDV